MRCTSTADTVLQCSGLLSARSYCVRYRPLCGRDVADTSTAFKKLMVKRNLELELEAFKCVCPNSTVFVARPCPALAALVSCWPPTAA